MRLVEAGAPQDKIEEVEKRIDTPLDLYFFNLLKHTTYNHFGFAREETAELCDILSRYAFSYMASKLHDKLHGHFCQKDISGLFEDSIDYIDQDLSRMKKTESNLHKILAKLNFNSLFDTAKTDLNRRLSGIIYCKNLEGADVDVFININTPCDIAQGKDNIICSSSDLI